MTEPAMSKDFDPNSVRKVVKVKAPPAVAWRVFTEQMGTWWPLDSYKIGKAKAGRHLDGELHNAMPARPPELERRREGAR